MNKERELIEDIRKKELEFSNDPKYIDKYEEHQNMKQTLSDTLYSKNSHFIYEMIQNAEDNKYDDKVDPTIKFIVSEEFILTQNNEQGFSEDNIKSICKFSSSSKKGKKELGFIGEKGLGFKSVFAVSDKPAIFSNGYQFNFTEGEYTIPFWIDNTGLKEFPNEFLKKDSTNILLPYKKDFKDKDDINKKIKEIEPILLLFLNKLNRLKIEQDGNEIVNVTKVVEILDNGIKRISINYSDKTESYYVFNSIIDKPKNLYESKRENILKREIIIAFPDDNNTISEDRIFSFLPTEMKSGMNFLIQADFLLTGSRESIIEGNEWNKWLLEEIVELFVSIFHKVRLINNSLKFNYLTYLNKNNGNNSFINKYYYKIIDNIKSEELFLTKDNEFVSAENIVILNDYDLYIKYLEDYHFENGLMILHKDFVVPQVLLKKWNIESIDFKKLLKIISESPDYFAQMFSNNNLLFEELLNEISPQLNKTGKKILKSLPIIPIDREGSISFYSKNDLKEKIIFIRLDNDGILNDVFEDIEVISVNYQKKIEGLALFKSVFNIMNPDILTILKSLKGSNEILKNKATNIKLLIYIKNNYLVDEKDDIINLLIENYLFYTENHQFIEILSKNAIYISGIYLNNNKSIESIVKKYCINKYDDNFDFVSSKYLETEESTSSKKRNILKKEWFDFFDLLKINDDFKLVDEKLDMWAWGSVNRYHVTKSYFNIPLFAKGKFSSPRDEEYIKQNIKIEALTKEDSIFLFKKIIKVQIYRETYPRVTGYYRGFDYDYSKEIPWLEVINSNYPIFIDDEKYKIKQLYLNVDDKLKRFFKELPNKYITKNNDITSLFIIKDSPVVKDVISLIDDRKTKSIDDIKSLIEYLHFNFKEETIALKKIPLLNSKNEIIYKSKNELIWENGKALGLIELNKTYDSDQKKFFIDQVGIAEKPTIDQYISYLSKKEKPKNYEPIFNQFVLALEEYIQNNIDIQPILNQPICHINGQVKSLKQIVFNDELIDYDKSKILFTVQKKIFEPFKKIVDFFNLKRLSKHQHEIITANQIESSKISDMYIKLLNFAWDYLYSNKKKEFEQKKEDKEFIINTRSVSNGAISDISLTIKIDGETIELPKKVTIQDGSICLSNTIEEKKQITELSKYIQELIGVEFEKIERFYDKVYKYKEYKKDEYYLEEKIESPLGEDTFEAVFEHYINKESPKKIGKTHPEKTSASNEGKNEYYTEPADIDDDNIFSSKEKGNSNESYEKQNQQADDSQEGTQPIEEFDNNDNTEEKAPSLPDAIKNNSRDVERKSKQIDPDTISDTEAYKSKAQEQFKKNIENSKSNVKRVYRSSTIKLGKEETKEFLNNQYKGHCQVCGFTFDKKNNNGKYFELFDWLDNKKNILHSNTIQAGSSLCLCAKCHSIMKRGDFNPDFIDDFGDDITSEFKFEEFVDLLDSTVEEDKIPEVFEFIEMDMYKTPVRMLNETRYIFFTEEHFLHFYSMLTLDNSIEI